MSGPRSSWLNLVVLAWLVLAFWLFGTLNVSSNTVPLKAVSDSQKGDALTARMWVDSARLYPWQTLRVHVIFENRSQYPLTGLRFLDFRRDGLVEAGGCWDKDHHPACETSSGAAVPLPDTLLPGEVLQREAELRADPSRSPGQFGILGVYIWTQADENPNPQARPRTRNVTHTGSLHLAPLAATTPVHEWLTAVLRLSPNMLPILLLIAGWLIDRERQRREQTEQLDRSRSDTVWTQQVARILNYTQTYYLPIARNILGLSKYHADMLALGAPATGTPEAIRRDALRRKMFFHFVMFWLSVRGLREGLGGWFLSSAKAEGILSRGWQVCMIMSSAHLNDEQLDAATDMFSRPVSLTKFLAKLAIVPPSGTSPLRTIEPQFYAWVDEARPAGATANSFEQTVSLLKVMRWVLSFEWDSPFAKRGYWYDEKKVVNPDELRNAVAGIPEPAARGVASGAKDELQLLLTEYQIKIDNYFKAQ